MEVTYFISHTLHVSSLLVFKPLFKMNQSLPPSSPVIGRITAKQALITCICFYIVLCRVSFAGYLLELLLFLAKQEEGAVVPE